MDVKENRFYLDIDKNIFKKEIIKWHKKLRGVRFNNIKYIHIICHDFEMENKELIWWSDIDLLIFKMNYNNSLMYRNFPS